jgi:hypothetical protein
MAQDSENDNVDLRVLQSLGKFDANYFLPVIARLSSTYLEIQKDKTDQVLPLSISFLLG